MKKTETFGRNGCYSGGAFSVVAWRCRHDRRMMGTGRGIGETMAKGDSMLLLRFRNNRVTSSLNMIILLTYTYILYYVHTSISLRSVNNSGVYVYRGLWPRTVVYYNIRTYIIYNNNIIYASTHVYRGNYRHNNMYILMYLVPTSYII